jgi:hypothetical protein
MKAPGTENLPRAVFRVYFASLIVWFIACFLPWHPALCWLQDIEGPTWASWTQAVGAIAALGFAYWYPERRLKQEAAAKEDAAYRATHSLAKDIHAQLVHSMAADPPRLDDLTIDHLYAAFRAIDATALNQVDQRHLTTIQNALRVIVRRLQADSPNPLSRAEVGQYVGALQRDVLVPMNANNRIY